MYSLNAKQSETLRYQLKSALLHALYRQSYISDIQLSQLLQQCCKK